MSFDHLDAKLAQDIVGVIGLTGGRFTPTWSTGGYGGSATNDGGAGMVQALGAKQSINRPSGGISDIWPTKRGNARDDRTAGRESAALCKDYSARLGLDVNDVPVA